MRFKILKIEILFFIELLEFDLSHFAKTIIEHRIN